MKNIERACWIGFMAIAFVLLAFFAGKITEQKQPEAIGTSTERCIDDVKGAEELLGRGDMLYLD